MEEESFEASTALPSTPPFSSHLSQFVYSPPTPLAFRSSPFPPAATSPTPSTPPLPLKRRPKPAARSTPSVAGSSPYFSALPAAAAFTPDAGAPSGSGAPLAGQVGGAEGDGGEDGPPPKKKKKPARPYADPSVYAHLEGLSDFLADDLDVILCGINPGVKSAELGQHYASPTNHYYKCLVGSGFTDRRLTPAEAHLLPTLYGIGATNLVPRPTTEASELSKEEMRANVPHFLEKVVRCRPRVVAFEGMAVAEVVLDFRAFEPLDREVKLERAQSPPSSPSSSSSSSFKLPLPVPPPLSLPSPTTAPPRANSASPTPTKPPPPPASPRKPRKKAAVKIKCGLQPIALTFPTGPPLYFYVLPSTSARVVAYQIEDKITIWKDLRAQIAKLKAGEALEVEGLVEYAVESVLGVDWEEKFKQTLEESLGGDLGERLKMEVETEGELLVERGAEVKVELGTDSETATLVP